MLESLWISTIGAIENVIDLRKWTKDIQVWRDNTSRESKDSATFRDVCEFNTDLIVDIIYDKTLK